MKIFTKYFEKVYKALLVIGTLLVIYIATFNGAGLPQWVAILVSLFVAGVNGYVLFSDMLDIDKLTLISETISFEDANDTALSRTKYLIFKIFNLIIRCIANLVITIIFTSIALFA